MERKDFLKNTAKILGLASLTPAVIEACSKSNGSGSSSHSSSDSTGTATGGTTTTGCSPSPQETAGPYPYDLSKNSAIFRTDITEGKAGLPLQLILTIVNSNNNCSAIEGARVDIWHCDKDGYYSEYSEPGYLGTKDYRGQTFLRGIQLSDVNGQVKFTTIYPGWYSGRVTHIHAEVFINSVLKCTTQIAFPDNISKAVYNTSLYSAHGQNSLTNTTDDIMKDSYNSELLSLTGDSTKGYTGTLQIGVAI